MRFGAFEASETREITVRKLGEVPSQSWLLQLHDQSGGYGRGMKAAYLTG
jgi:hypothetical protein